MKDLKRQSRGFMTAQTYSYCWRRLPECSWQLVKWLMCVDLRAPSVNTLFMFHFAHKRVSVNRTDLEQLGVKLRSILEIVGKYRENGGLRALDYRVERFCLYVRALFCPCLFDTPQSSSGPSPLKWKLSKSCMVTHYGLALSKVRRMPTRYSKPFRTSAVCATSFRWVCFITGKAVRVHWSLPKDWYPAAYRSKSRGDLQGNFPKAWIMS
jgi:hypothetical protein